MQRVINTTASIRTPEPKEPKQLELPFPPVQHPQPKP